MCGRPVGRPASRPVGRSADRLVGRSAGQSVARPVDWPVCRSSSDEWVPLNAQAAMYKIFDLSVAGGDTDLAAFVKSVSEIGDTS